MKYNFTCWNCGSMQHLRKSELSNSTIYCPSCGATTCPHAEGIEPRYSWIEYPKRYFCLNTYCGERMEHEQ